MAGSPDCLRGQTDWTELSHSLVHFQFILR